MNKDIETVEEAVRALYEEVKKVFIETVDTVNKAVSNLPPKYRYKFLRSLGVDKDKIILFFNRESEKKTGQKGDF